MNSSRSVRALLCGVLLLGALLGPAAGGQGAPSRPPRGGTLIEGLPEDPGQLLPNFSGRLYTLLVQQVLFAPLFYSDDHGIEQPGLASEVPTVANGGISPDGTIYTFHLRKGLRWSDGTALTARDVDFSWRLWTTPALASSVYSTLGFDRIGNTTISADGLSITFKLVTPFAPFLAAWTDTPGILPAHVLGLLKPANVPTSGFALAPTVNSGPFKLTEVEKGSRLVVVRNPLYYRGAEGYPYLDSISFRTIPTQAGILAALQAHTIDTAWLLPITSLDSLRRIPGLTVLPLQDANWEAAIVNLRRPVLQDVRVRQALEYGLDRAAEVRDVWHGLASPIASDQPPISSVFAQDISPYPYDPARAAQLLDEAGWVLGADGWRHKGTQRLSITYSSTFNNPWRHADEFQAVSDYERLGIQLTVVNYPAQVFLDQILPNGSFDLAEYVFNSPLDPDDSANFDSHLTYPRGNNYGAYSNPEFDRLAGQELATVDPLQRAALFHRMQQVLHDDLPALWLYSPYDLAAAGSRVHNYRPGPFSLDTWNAWEWYVGG